MTDLTDSLERFLDGADDVYAEYDQGYVDADAALAQLEDHLDELEEAVRE